MFASNNNASAKANDKAAKRAEKRAAKEAKRNAPLSFWGYWLRMAFWMLVLIAAVTAICLGMHFGLVYLAAIGLGETLTAVLSVFLAIVGHVAAFCVGWNIGSVFDHLTARRLRTKLAEEIAARRAPDAGLAAAA